LKYLSRLKEAGATPGKMNKSFGEFFDNTANEFEVASNPSEYIPETPPPEPVEEPQAPSPMRTPPRTVPLPSPVAEFNATPVKEAEARPEEKPKPKEPQYGTLNELHNTPRTREAVKRAGLSWAETQRRDFKSFYVNGENLPEAQEMRHVHYETRRIEKVNLVMRERAKLIRERTEEKANPSSFRALQSIEGLLDDELRRLEKNLRTQVRVHSSTENANNHQLERERKLTDKLAYRTGRIQVAQAQYGVKGDNQRQISEAKSRHSQELLQNMKSERLAKQTAYLADQLEEEVRLEEHRRQKDILSSEKSEVWKQKCHNIKRRNEDLEMSREIWGMKVMADSRTKLGHIEVAQQNRLKAWLLQHAEASLKHADTKSSYDRIQRLDLNRREQIASHLKESESRISALHAVKDQVVEQRKKRLVQQSILKSRPADLNSVTPGPGQYGAQSHVSCLNELPVTKISTANPVNLTPGSFDHMMKLAKENPPPGTYNPKVLPKGKHLDLGAGMDGGGVKFTPEGVPLKNFLDDAVQAKKELPGPGTYDLKASLELQHSVRLVQKKFPELNQLPTFVPKPRDAPGPDEYCVDKFTKQGRINDRSQSMPALEKAMKMT
jgi:hypothetical protein